MNVSDTLWWGVLSTAKIGREKVIPAMQTTQYSQVFGLASRDFARGKEVAEELKIARVFQSYDELIEEPSIDAIYIPLPNHLHVEWTKKAIMAGKHVLSEKPLALNIQDVQELIALRDEHQVRVGEAFMVKNATQWKRVKELIQGGAIGKLKAVQGFFSYFNDDPQNIRNKYVEGGGALWDIGVYPIVTTGFVLDESPEKVVCEIEHDQKLGIDAYASAIIKYPSVTLNFQCSTQLVPYQRMQFFGTKGSIEVLIPFNAPKDTSCVVKVHRGDVWE